MLTPCGLVILYSDLDPTQIIYGTKLIIRSLNLLVQPWNFRNKEVISSYILLGMRLLIHAGI